MTVVSIAQGDLRGAPDGEVLRFAGIPFAAPPVADRRFRPPTAHGGWEGVREAVDFGPTSIQGPDPMAMLTGAESEPTDEDCLFLNVWTPGTDEAARPVMVWIHGGGFFMGSGSHDSYRGKTLAERGDVVIVTLNYRLGALGFLHLDDVDDDYAGSGNNGILDQVAGLEWVRDNIAAFGGDPTNVTVFGESAGAMSVCTLLGLPAAEGLFHRAIAQSGAAHNVHEAKKASEITSDFMGRLEVSTMEDLLGLDAAAFVDAQGDLMGSMMTGLIDESESEDGPGPTGISLPFQPVHDGTVLPEPPIEAVRSGHAADVAFLSGTNLDETKLFEMFLGPPLDDEALDRRLAAVFGDVSQARAAYDDAYNDADGERTPSDLASAMATDLTFRQPAIRMAEAQLAHQPASYHYLFTWATPAMGGILGSCHALEIPFVFGTLESAGLSMLLGDAPPAALSDVMADAWLAFARTGNPSHDGLPEWPRYDTGSRRVMELGDENQLLDDPQRSVRELWTTVL